MDSKIMDMIDTAVARLPEKIPQLRYRQYEEAKRLLKASFPGDRVYQYLCEAAARKYDI